MTHSHYNRAQFPGSFNGNPTSIHQTSLPIPKGNIAVFDAGNVLPTLREQLWNKIDFKKFRQLLRDKFNIEKAVIFIGEVERNKGFYAYLSRCGFDIEPKAVVTREDGTEKSDADADIGWYLGLNIQRYNKVVLIAGDVDYYKIVNDLNGMDKLAAVLAPSKRIYQKLRQAAGNFLFLMEDFRHLIESNIPNASKITKAA